MSEVIDKDKIISDLHEIIKEQQCQIKCNNELIQKLISTIDTQNRKDVKNVDNSFRSAEILEKEPERSPDLVYLEKHNDNFLKITGKTYPIRNIIKETLGSIWLQDLKCWILPINSKETLKSSLNTSNISFVDKV